MDSSTPLKVSIITSFFAALSHILSASLQTWLVGSVKVDMDNAGLHYYCTEDFGLFRTAIVSGGQCPTSYSGEDTIKAVCGDNKNPNSNDCDLVRTGQAMVILSSIFSIVTFLLVTYQYYRRKKDLTFSKLKVIITWLTIFAGLCSVVSISIFEVRSHDEDSGWADNYGCSTGTISILFSLQGTQCFQRGAAYIFCCLGLTFSLSLGVVNCVVGREFFNKESERYGSFYTNLEETV